MVMGVPGAAGSAGAVSTGPGATVPSIVGAAPGPGATGSAPHPVRATRTTSATAAAGWVDRPGGTPRFSTAADRCNSVARMRGSPFTIVAGLIVLFVLSTGAGYSVGARTNDDPAGVAAGTSTTTTPTTATE